MTKARLSFYERLVIAPGADAPYRYNGLYDDGSGGLGLKLDQGSYSAVAAHLGDTFRATASA